MPALSSRQASDNGKKGGRKPGQEATTKLIALRAMEIIKTGNAPVDVMLKNMLHWFQKAQDLSSKFEAMMADGLDMADPESIKEAHQLFRAMLVARDKSQECAVDLAPYVHPRLASITVKPDEGEGDAVIKRIEKVFIAAGERQTRGNTPDRSAGSLPTVS